VPDQKSTETEAPRTNGVTKRSNGKSATKKKETNSEKDPKKVGSDKIAAIEEVFEVPATPKKKTGQVSEPPLDRPVLPQRSNATLMTPRGSSVVAYPAGAEDVSPSKSGLPRPVATTGNLLEKALAHLIATDERLRPIIEQHHCRIFSPEGLAEQIDPFEALTSSIIGQQVSGAAAKSIKNKFVGLFHNDSDGQKADRRRFPMPAEVAKLDIATLRTAGLSQRKAEYIQGLAEKFVSGELSAQNLLTATDDEVMEMLIAVRGLGKWSVEMFSCFALKRTDVFSTGDLGVQ
jgi:DNA-3-methyladenine glycosylase II